jgi:hypothetical protein
MPRLLARLVLLAAMPMVVHFSAAAADTTTDTIQLFNGKDLTGWTSTLAEPQADPAKTWIVREGVIRCEGKPNGYLRTTKAYSSYKLHVEWRYPQPAGNSGILLQMQGPDEVWPPCIEAQLGRGGAGDFITVNKASAAEGSEAREGKAGDWHIPRLKSTKSTELSGEVWNSYDIICKGNSIELFVNGTAQNKLTSCSLQRGFIGLQSEGSVVEFRNISIRPLGNNE